MHSYVQKILEIDFDDHSTNNQNLKAGGLSSNDEGHTPSLKAFTHQNSSRGVRGGKGSTTHPLGKTAASHRSNQNDLMLMSNHQGASTVSSMLTDKQTKKIIEQKLAMSLNGGGKRKKLTNSNGKLPEGKTEEELIEE